MCKKTTIRIAIATAMLFASGRLTADDLMVLAKDPNGVAHTQMTQRFLKKHAAAAFQRWRDRYETLKTPEQISAYQEDQRRFFIDQIGGLPERTPLNARTVGRMDHEYCRVEKVIFESQPKHFVTSLLFLPKTPPPYPGVIVPCGHAANGKAAASYQRLCILLATNGIAALCFDPIGQGERYQLLDENGEPRFKSTTEHTLVGVGSILVGRNTASYRIWDGMRSLDYLASREDIDGTRLGCTGNSGGGTLTEYLMALDPRIRCAVPSCCVTTFARRLETIGPGDAEQNIFGQIAFGMDHTDYTLMRAPRPTLLAAATGDYVDIEGSWDIFRDAKRFYTRMGFAERVDLIEVDGKHGYSRLKREAATRWMCRWLLGKDQAITEPDFDVFSPVAVQCSPDGQVQLMDDARSVMAFNSDIANRHEAERRELWRTGNRRSALATVRKLAGIRRLEDIPMPTIRQTGILPREGYEIRKLVLQPQDGILLPGLLFCPSKPSGRRVLYLHEDGKRVVALPNREMESLVNQGALVLAVDPRGTGETGTSNDNLWGGHWDDIFLAYLLGKSMVGMRAEDMLVAARYLATSGDAKPAGKGSNTTVEVIAVGKLGPPALHAVALERSLFDKLTLRETTTSWLPALRDATTKGQLVNVVHGALRSYDLADLLNSLPTGKTHVANSVLSKD